jgi:phosphatidylserine decarboxylase
MEPSFEDSQHLDPELTWEESATFLYDGIMSGKLTREDFIKYFMLSGQEMSEPRHARIMGKALAVFFKCNYRDLPADEKPGIFIIIDGKNYVVSHNDKEITIEKADDIADCSVENGSFLISHETEADAKIAAWKNGEKYVERL